jgi:hypothetical protein
MMTTLGLQTEVTEEQVEAYEERSGLLRRAVGSNNKYHFQFAKHKQTFIQWLAGWGMSTSELLTARIKKPHRITVDQIINLKQRYGCVISRQTTAVGDLGEDGRHPWHGFANEQPSSVLLSTRLGCLSRWCYQLKPFRLQRPQSAQRCLLAQAAVIPWLDQVPLANILPAHLLHSFECGQPFFGRPGEPLVTARRKEPDVVLMPPDGRIIAVYVQRPGCSDYDDMPTVASCNEILSRELVDGIIHLYPPGSEWQMSTPHYVKRTGDILKCPAGQAGRIQVAIGHLPAEIPSEMALPSWFGAAKATQDERDELRRLAEEEDKRTNPNWPFPREDKQSV